MDFICLFDITLTCLFWLLVVKIVFWSIMPKLEGPAPMAWLPSGLLLGWVISPSALCLGCLMSALLPPPCLEPEICFSCTA